MPIPKPSEEIMQWLLDLKVAIRGNQNTYVFSPDFVQTAENIRKNPPGLFKSRKLASTLVKTSKTYLLAYPKESELITTAFVMLLYHIERLNLKVDNSQLPLLSLAVTYMNEEENKK